MAHQLTLNGSKAEMAYIGDTPWHGLGQKLSRGASIEEWQEGSGMNWKVQRSMVRYFAERDGTRQEEWPAHNVLFRSDTKAPLGLVSSKFKVVQPKATLEFFRDLVEDSGFTLETAGTLFGGRRFWALASVGEHATIFNPADVVGSYLLLCTAVDGTLESTARFTSICVVCNNTLSAALSESTKREAKVSHRSVFDAAAVKAQLGVGRGDFLKFITEMRMLSKAKLTVKGADALTRKLLVPSRIDTSAYSTQQLAELAQKTRDSKNYQSIMQLFNGAGRGAQLTGRKDTAWGWVNAVTEHVDYFARTQIADTRLDSAWFGKGDALKTQAVELAHGYMLEVL